MVYKNLFMTLAASLVILASCGPTHRASDADDDDDKDDKPETQTPPDELPASENPDAPKPEQPKPEEPNDGEGDSAEQTEEPASPGQLIELSTLDGTWFLASESNRYMTRSREAIQAMIALTIEGGKFTYRLEFEKKTAASASTTKATQTTSGTIAVDGSKPRLTLKATEAKLVSATGTKMDAKADFFYLYVNKPGATDAAIGYRIASGGLGCAYNYRAHQAVADTTHDILELTCDGDATAKLALHRISQ